MCDCFDRDLRAEQTYASGDEGEHEAFHKELADNSISRRTERSANAQFALPC
jgi:hypothetical protein